jgi:hypothetical protein
VKKNENSLNIIVLSKKERLTFSIKRFLFKVKAKIQKTILKKNFLPGFNLNLSSYNPNKKKDVAKKKTEIYSLFKITIFLKGVSKNNDKKE